MKAVTAAFMSALQNPRTEVGQELAYKRRKWDATEQEYAWEDDWTVISQADMESLSAITQQLDSENLNEFKVSNVTAILWNRDNRWREDNPFGIFKKDAGSPLHAYNPYWTKFRVRASVKLADGSTEYVTCFTGLAVEYTFASNERVQVTIQGLESLLMNANAENVSTLVTEENAGTGNGSIADFVTDNPGVGIIDEVSLNGVKKIPGTDFDVSDLDSPTLGATVSFTTPPGVGVVVRITYRYWQQNKRVEELVGDLLTEAGIPGANQDVEPVLFANPIQSAVVIDSQALWQAGTPTSIDLTSVPGAAKIDITDSANFEILDDFTDGNFSANPVWTREGGLTWTVPSNRLRYDKAGTSDQGVIHTPGNGAQIGVWKWLMNGWGPTFDKVTFGFMASGNVYMTFFPFHPYSFTGNYLSLLAPPYSSDPSHLEWKLFINNIQVASTIFDPPTASDFTVKIVRYSNGLTQVFVDSGSGFSLVLQGQSATSVGYSWFGIGSELGAFIITDRQMDNFYIPKTTFTGQWSSPTYDLSAGVISLGRLIANYTAGDGSVTFETRTSTDGSTWDAWTEINPTGQVQSAVKRYLQVRVTFSHPSSSYNEPIVYTIRVEFQTAVATITLAKFTGQTVYQAIQSMGRFSNYEWGFDSEEVFFFRAKAPRTNPDKVLTRADIASISGMTTGYDRVYSEVRVTYGAFNSKLVAQGDSPGDPLARFGTRIFEVSVTDIIIGNDADIASGVAKLFFRDLSKPKRRFKAVCRFLPEVDLSDTLRVTFDQNRQRKTWSMGDETVNLGDNDVHLWGPKEQLVSEMLCKVIGTRNDLKKSTELEMEEIL